MIHGLEDRSCEKGYYLDCRRTTSRQLCQFSPIDPAVDDRGLWSLKLRVLGL